MGAVSKILKILQFLMRCYWEDQNFVRWVFVLNTFEKDLHLSKILIISRFDGSFPYIWSIEATTIDLLHFLFSNCKYYPRMHIKSAGRLKLRLLAEGEN